MEVGDKFMKDDVEHEVVAVDEAGEVTESKPVETPRTPDALDDVPAPAAEPQGEPAPAAVETGE